MKRQVFSTSKIPQPRAPYSQAVIHNEILYVAGQGPVEAATGRLFQGTIEEETRVTLDNLKTIIEEAGYPLGGVLKTTCYLLNMDDFDKFNSVYREYFPDEPPARTTIQAGRLISNMKVEIDAIVGHT